MVRFRVYFFCAIPLICSIIGLPQAGHSDIYRYVDENGVVQFTDTPTSGHFRFHRKERGSSSGAGGPVTDLIVHYASKYGLDASLVKAVIKVESDYDPMAVSSKGALGLMQLIPETAKDMNVADPLSPDQNIAGGTRYLRLMLDQFGGDLELALAAYNAGPGSVKRYGGIPPFAETIRYVQKVKKYLLYYRQGKDVIL